LSKSAQPKKTPRRTNASTAHRQLHRKNFPERKKQSQSKGKLRGIGLSNAIERAAAPGMEYAEVRFDSTGTVLSAKASSATSNGCDLLAPQRFHDQVARKQGHRFAARTRAKTRNVFGAVDPRIAALRRSRHSSRAEGIG